MKLRDIMAQLRHIYCGTIGAEFAHVSDTDERLWLQDHFQDGRVLHQFSAEEQRNILWQLTAAEGLERYLHTKYVGQKRFSLEGGDSLIPLLDDLVQQGGLGGVEEFVIGMAHRGRLNVLVNVLGKSPAEPVLGIRRQVRHDASTGSGDVKYHKGFSADLRHPAATCTWRWPSIPRISRSSIRWSKVRCARARNVAATRDGDKVLPVLIHGDAAFAGQGVVMETLQLSQARGFCTGGTRAPHRQQPGRLHHQRSARLRARRMYCSDVAKMIEAPIFHVNGDDPEAVRVRDAPGARRTACVSTRTWSSTWSATAASATTKPTSRRPRSR